MADEVNISRESLRELGNMIRGGGSSAAAPSSSFSNPFTGSASPSNIASGFGGAIDTVYGAAKNLYSHATGFVNDWRKVSSETGISFSNDAYGLRTSVAQTRMELYDWQETIKTAGPMLTGLGGTMSEGAKTFNRVSAQFANTFADKITTMGFTTEEYNKILALNIAGNKKLHLSDAEGAKAREETTKATMEMGIEMAKVAELTGKSRKEQMAVLEAQRTDARLQVKLDQQLREGGEQARTSWQKSTLMLGAVGPDVQKLFKELYTGEVQSPEAKAMQTNLGDAATLLAEAASAQKTARSPEEFAAAEKRVEEARLAVIKKTESSEFQSRIGGTGLNADLAGKTYVDTMAARAADEIMKTQGKSFDDAMKIAKLALESKTKEGEVVEGAKTTEATVILDNTLKDTNAVLNEIYGVMNKRIAQEIAKSGVVEKFTNAPGKQSRASKMRNVVAEPLNQLIEAKSIKEAYERMGNIRDKIDDYAIKPFTDGVKNAAVEFNNTVNKSSSSNVINIPSQTTPNNKTPKLATGTKGVFGEDFHDFGKESLAFLHGNEMVLPEKDLPKFLMEKMNELGLSGNTGVNDKMFETFKNTIDNFASQTTTQPQPNIQEPVKKQETNEIQSTAFGTITLKEINDQLVSLNNSMVRLIANTSEFIDISGKQNRAIKQLNPNVNAR
jgi:hypothetical protein